MTDPRRRTASSCLFLAALAFFLLSTVGSSPVQAQAAASEARAPKAEQTKKPRPVVAGQAGKAAGAKAKRVRVSAKAAKPAAESAAQAAPQSTEKAPATPPVGTTETVNFDADADDQKMEPGLDFIQAAPRRARHRSLVPATPSPEDSVVNRP